MTKIYLRDNSLKIAMLNQYHPYISIDLWNLQQEQLEQFAQISEETLSIDSTNTFITINTENVSNATLIIYNHDYDNDDNAVSIDDYLLFQKTINQSETTHIISVDDLNIEHLTALNNEDIITVTLYHEDNIIYTRNYKITFVDEDSFYCLSDTIINDYVNLKIVEKDIRQLLYQTDNSEYMLNHYNKYISQPNDPSNQGNYDNIIFTPEDDWNTIIPFEYHRGVFYLRLPFMCHKICLHIISKYYSAMDNVALFTTDDILGYLHDNPPAYAWLSSRQIDDVINSTSEDGTKTRYLIDLPFELRQIPCIEIDAFYLYTDENTNMNNQLGIVDTTLRGYDDIELEAEDQKTLVASNLNLLENNSPSTNQIIEVTRNYTGAFFQPLESPLAFSYGITTNPTYYFRLQERHKKDIIYETTIKYFNDDIYVEEYNPRTTNNVDRVNELKTNNQYNYIVEEWSE